MAAEARNQKKGASGESTSATKSKFMAHTSGHKDVYFTTGSTKDAVAFQGTVQKLARHVSTVVGRKQGLMVGKAMINLRDLLFNPPSRPVRQYYNMNSMVTTNRATARTKNIVVMDDLDYKNETGSIPVRSLATRFSSRCRGETT